MIVPAFYFARGGRQRPGVVPAIPGHLDTYYIDKNVLKQAPPGDKNEIRRPRESAQAPFRLHVNRRIHIIHILLI